MLHPPDTPGATLWAKRAATGSGRMFLTFCDQGVSSASNFIVGLAVARLAGPTEFGAYMLTFTLWLVVVGCHRAAVTEPIVVTLGGRDDPQALAHGVSAELLLGAAVSAVAVLGGLAALSLGGRVATPMLAMAPWFASLLVQDYWRATAFRQRRPGLALANDAVFAAVQVGAAGTFWLLGWRSVGSMITAWGIGATAGALLGLMWFPASWRPSLGRRLVRRLWPLSRWLLLDFVTGFTADQSYLILVAGLLSGVAYGGFRAALNLMGPMMVLVLAGANIGLPAAAARANSDDPEDLRRFARRMSLLATLGIGSYGLVIAVAGRRLMRLLYGPQFGRFGLLATLAALQYAIPAVVLGQGVALKAAGRLRRLWRLRALTAIASFISVVALVRWLGTAGAGWGGVATAVYYAASMWWLYHREIGRGGAPGPFRTGTGEGGRALVVTFSSIGEAAAAASGSTPPAVTDVTDVTAETARGAAAIRSGLDGRIGAATAPDPAIPLGGIAGV